MHILDANIYNGETVDFTSDISEINPVRELDDVNKEILISTEGEVTREMIRLDATKIFTTPKGETVIDFGQDITGYVEWDYHRKKVWNLLFTTQKFLIKTASPLTHCQWACLLLFGYHTFGNFSVRHNSDSFDFLRFPAH